MKKNGESPTVLSGTSVCHTSQSSTFAGAGPRKISQRCSTISQAAAIAWLAAYGFAGAAALPTTLAPPAPFPLVLSTDFAREFVAPGITRGRYRLETSAGPLVVSFVTVDPREPTVRLAPVLAHDRIVSSGETVSSMANRTNAVAGINADYFDIGNTNTPLGILATTAGLERTPSTRAALTITRERSVRIETYRFAGSAQDGGNQIPITSVNEWPPQGGAAFITPAYGIPPLLSNGTIAELVPLAHSASGALPSGRYRIAQVDVGSAPTHPGFALGLGPVALNGLSPLPDVGDLIDVTLDTDPPLADVEGAVGGGPALLAAGEPVDDPLSPGYAARARRIPIAAVARFNDGTLAFITVDGREPLRSIGVNRAELIALLQGLGAADAMQFDSGGSATLVARTLGETGASVQNNPSDGVERPVADGLFAYSDAPLGPPARLVVRPSRLIALPGARIPLRATIVDAAGHALGDARGPWHVSGHGATIDDTDVLHVSTLPLETTLDLERNGVHAELPLDVVAAVTKIAIVPARPNPEPDATVALHALAFDARGRHVEIGDALAWSALRGTIDRDGLFHAGRVDGFVTAAIGATRSSTIVRVGHHRESLAWFDAPHRVAWTFSTIPVSGPGSLAFAGTATLSLSYDFSASERAAYAHAVLPLGEPLALSCAIDGDGNGAAIRFAVTDRYGARAALTLARSVDWTGAERRTVRIPRTLAPPLALQSIYAIGTLGRAPLKAAGTIGLRDCDLLVPGSAPRVP